MVSYFLPTPRQAEKRQHCCSQWQCSEFWSEFKVLAKLKSANGACDLFVRYSGHGAEKNKSAPISGRPVPKPNSIVSTVPDHETTVSTKTSLLSWVHRFILVTLTGYSKTLKIILFLKKVPFAVRNHWFLTMNNGMQNCWPQRMTSGLST